MQTATLLTIQAKEVKSSFAEVEQDLLLIYTLQEAKPKKHSKHLQGFFVAFFFNSTESHIKNKTKKEPELARGRACTQPRALHSVPVASPHQHPVPSVPAESVVVSALPRASPAP